MYPIRIGDEGREATRAFVARLEQFAPEWASILGSARIESLREQLGVLERIDRQHGGQAPLALEGTDELLAAILSELAHSYRDLRTAAAGEALDDVTLGVALWAIRHDVPIPVVEPVVNALAGRANAARSREALAAIFGLMQGVIANVAPRLSADLERSNPERPWRPLHLNLAITAIRTEDPQMMDFAFDALERALPDERAGFFAEALTRALGPGIHPEVRRRLEERHRKWTPNG